MSIKDHSISSAIGIFSGLAGCGYETLGVSGVVGGIFVAAITDTKFKMPNALVSMFGTMALVTTIQTADLSEAPTQNETPQKTYSTPVSTRQIS
ncbi:MAG: hypothetical protein ACPG05_00490 [Bdellovibrionales bacterium]